MTVVCNEDTGSQIKHIATKTDKQETSSVLQ